MRPWFAADRRLQYGHYDRLMAELRAEDTSSFFNFMRMEPAMFDELLHRVSSRISKDDTRMRKALDPGLKFAATLWYLASGDKYTSLQYDFRVSRVTSKKFLPDVCQAIVEQYSSEVITCPMEADAWREVAEGSKTKWNVPHAVGAMDGKHIAIRKPPNSGSLYRNYKGFSPSSFWHSSMPITSSCEQTVEVWGTCPMPKSSMLQIWKCAQKMAPLTFLHQTIYQMMTETSLISFLLMTPSPSGRTLWSHIPAGAWRDPSRLPTTEYPGAGA